MFARLVLAWHQPQIRAYRAALLELTQVLQGQHEGQGGQCSNSLYLPQQLGFLALLLGECFEFAVVIPYAGTQRGYGLEDGLQRFSQGFWYPIGDLVVEARSRALGQTMTEGLDRAAYPRLISCVREPTNASRERIIAYQEPGRLRCDASMDKEARDRDGPGARGS